MLETPPHRQAIPRREQGYQKLNNILLESYDLAEQ